MGRVRIAALACVVLMVIAGLAGAARATGAAAVAAGSGEHPLYVALVWHNHQPLYKNPATGVYMMPWVRMHAVKDYYDMAAILKDYPDVHVTFNMVPSLLAQLDEYAAGAFDLQLIASAKPAAELTDADRDFLLRRFFDANWDNIISRYPRYWELLQKRGTAVSDASIAAARDAYTEQDFRDLQVWFNLAWIDPGLIAADPSMTSLVEKGRNFTEADKALVLAKHTEIVRKVVPLYREMQATGQIEVITTPFYHPIMPLIYDSSLARVASPKLDLPATAFTRPDDVAAQLALAADSYRAHFGREVRGLWPSEQAVGQDIVDRVHDAGFSWMVSSEGVLARSLGAALRDGAGHVVRPELLYRPYIVEQDGKPVSILFRDIDLSDKIGFGYSGMTAAAAVRDFMGYLKQAKADLASTPGPHIITVALDGENCWEYYPNDGHEFLNGLYAALSSDPDFRTVTVEEYLAMHPATERIPTLHTGSWIGDNLDTWIGEAEENRAWEYLANARAALATAEAGAQSGAQGGAPSADADAIAAARDEMYAAEGSDWFWWYGDDQSSGNDEAFDELFRLHLQNVYSLLGLRVPDYLYVPIIPRQPAEAEERISGLMREPVMDGRIDWGEWEKSAYYQGDQAELPIASLRVGVDAENLYLRIMADGGFRQFYEHDTQIAAYISTPRRSEVNALPRFSAAGAAATMLGFPIGAEVLVDFAGVTGVGTIPVRLNLAAGNETWLDAGELAAGVGEALEIAVPFERLGIRGSDAAAVRLVVSGAGANTAVAPAGGPAQFKAPVVTAGKRLFLLDDPKGDDHGPGTYTYPTNPVFTPGCFDMLSFECVDSGDEVTFNVRLAAEIVNHWNSGIGLSVQTIDIYIDTDGKPGSGNTDTLGGRRVKFAPESGWEYAVWVEGWNQRVFAADGTETGGVAASVDAINNVVSIVVPKSIIGTPEPGWGFQVFVMGQEGFPSQGNLRVREVVELAAEWRFGGGDNGLVDPNVIDMLAPSGDARTQETILGAYSVEARKLAEVPMVYPTW